MSFLIIITSIVLGLIAVLHIAWAFELWWPIRDERRLVAAVVGFRDATRMPGAIPCGLVAGVLVAMIALLWLPEDWVRSVGLLGAGVVLALRGILAYIPVWRRLTPQQPFARNDQMIYGPLCLVLAAVMLSARV